MTINLPGYNGNLNLNLMQKLLLLILLPLCIISCKKNESDPSGKSLRIKAETDAGGSMIYTYNADRKIVKAEFDNGFKKEEYLYEPGKITHSITEASNTYTIHYTLGSNGYVQSKQMKGDNMIDYYDYNQQGFITRSYNNQQPMTETKYYYTNNVLDSMRGTKGNMWFSTTVLLYYNDRINTLGDENFGRGFFGKSYPHPPKAIANRRPDGNQVKVSVTNYAYTYDDRGRISGRSFTTSGGQSGGSSFSYYE